MLTVLGPSLMVIPEKVKSNFQVIFDGLFDRLGVLGAFHQSFPGVKMIPGMKVAVGNVIIFF